MALTRISITIPGDLVAAADAKAQQLDRSRSWVLSDALRRYLGEPRRDAVREPAVIYDVRAEIEASRDRRLLSELALAPLDRVTRAEQLGALGSRNHPPRALVLGFSTYEDYYAWKQAQRMGA